MINSICQILRRAPGLVTSASLGVAAAFTAKVSGVGLSFLFSLMLARLLGPAGTGVYFLAFTLVSIGATISRLGLDTAILRFAAVVHDQGDRPTLAALYRQSIGLVVAAGVAVTLFIWSVAPYLPLGGERFEELQVILPVMLIAIIPTSLILLQGEFFKATGAPGIAAVIQAVVLPMFLVMGTAAFFWQGDATTHDIALLYVFAAATSVLVAGAAWSRWKLGLWREKGHFDIRLLLRTSLPLLWVASMGLILGWTDILVLGAWTDSATVGVYGVATRIAALTTMILVAVNSVTAPRFAALHAQGNNKALERLAQRSAGWTLLAASPIIFFLLLCPERILQLFGTDFVGGASVLRILALGQLIHVSMGSVGYLLMMTGHGRLMRNTIILAALLNCIGNLILVPIHGAMGAAVSTAFSLSVMKILAFLLVNHKLKINTLGYIFGGNR